MFGGSSSNTAVLPEQGVSNIPYSLSWPFYVAQNKASGSQHWSWGNITMGVDPSFLPNYTASDSKHSI